MTSDKPLSYACHRTGLSRTTLITLAEKDSEWGIYKLTPNGKWRCDADRFEARLAAEKSRQSVAFLDTVRSTGGEHQPPEAQLAKYAAYDIRHVMLYARASEHSPYWRNAKFVRSNLPADIVAAFNLSHHASFEIAVEHADKLLSMPLAKQAEAMKAIAARLTAFHGEEV